MPQPAKSMAKQHRRIAVWTALGCLALLVAPRIADAGPGDRRTPAVLAIQKVQPSVVSISSEKNATSNARWPYTAEETQRPRISGMGTGVIIDGRGYILTNQHVVDHVSGVEVILHDGSTMPAIVLQEDPGMDIAILKVNPTRPLTPITIGTSADLMEGENVITIGNAFGYENTKSVGIISALGRNVTLSDDQVYRNLIQTDACINPGNSGGPLVNMDGELIGINVAVRAGAQGIGFALPIDDVKKVVVEMMSTRRLSATWHGLKALEALKPEGRHVILADVQSGSPAENAGLKRGDRVVRVGALNVQTPIDIERGLLDVPPGQKVDVVIEREGRPQTLALEPQALNRSPQSTASRGEPATDPVYQSLGLKVVPVSSEYVRSVSPTFHGGLYVQSVVAGSPAARASIQKGDILVGMNAGNRNWETVKHNDVLFILNQPDVQRTRTLQYYLVRHNEFIQGRLSLADGATVGLRR